jgi:hypothetical protein
VCSETMKLQYEFCAVDHVEDCCSSLINQNSAHHENCVSVCDKDICWSVYFKIFENVLI